MDNMLGKLAVFLGINSDTWKLKIINNYTILPEWTAETWFANNYAKIHKSI